MKKIISLIAGIAILLTFASCAFAEKALITSSAISKTLTSTTTYYNALAKKQIDKDSSKANWNAPFNGATESQRVVVRIYQYGEDVVSSTWVYTGYNTTRHPYKTKFQDQSIKVFLGAKVDDRDEGPISISGTFYSSK